MVRKAEKAVYTESGGTKKHPFWGPCIYKGERRSRPCSFIGCCAGVFKESKRAAANRKNDEAESFKSKETTVIQEHTTLQGDMNTEDNITIHGVFIGNISCGGDLTISGSVKGNISCKNAVIQQAKIEGDIVCDTHLEISQGSCVHGNVNAKQILCGGQIIGDTRIEGKSQFLASSAISGDIQTQCLEVECGAVLQGNLQVQASCSA